MKNAENSQIPTLTWWWHYENV